jgi:hypothetical protein
MTTGTTFKESTMTSGVAAMTPTTLLAGIVGSNIHHPDTFQGNFVLQEELQFPEGPLMYPPIILCVLSDIGQVLHHQHISCRQVLNDSLGNIVVDPGHKPFPPTARML